MFAFTLDANKYYLYLDAFTLINKNPISGIKTNLF